MLRLVLTVMMVTMLMVRSSSSTCPPCPGPPVHACCKVDVQVEGTCCQVRVHWKTALLIGLTASSLHLNIHFTAGVNWRSRTGGTGGAAGPHHQHRHHHHRQHQSQH